MQSKADEIVRSLSLLIDGFESPYGLELLSSVHFIAKNDKSRNFEDVYSSFSSWSERKKRIFPKDVVKVAYDRLSTDGLIWLTTLLSYQGYLEPGFQYRE